MTANIEVEFRGPLSREGYSKLHSIFKEKGKFKESKKRKIITYSLDVRNMEKDIRIRETNGIPEIVIKLGKWGNEESREEISIKCENGKFDDLTKILALLGYNKGMSCVRNAEVFDFNGIEFALVEVPNHSHYFEAEILTTTKEAESAKDKIKKVCNDLGLKIFTEEEFFQYIETLNRESNLAFDFSNHLPLTTSST